MVSVTTMDWVSGDNTARPPIVSMLSTVSLMPLSTSMDRPQNQANSRPAMRGALSDQ